MDSLDRETTGTPTSISSDLAEQLRKSAPWMQLFSALGFIFSILMIVMTVKILLLNPGTAFPISYLTMAIVSFIPSFYLWQSTVLLKRFFVRNDSEALGAAFSKQVAFWFYAGVVMIIFLAISVYIFLIEGKGLGGII